MTLDEYNIFCASLPHTTHVVQWGGADVWKVGGKLFAVAGWNKDGLDDFLAVTFKTSDIAYHVLKDEAGLRPAPYLASRGMKWIQHYAPPGMDDENLKVHIEASYKMAVERLTKKIRAELGL
ncbi:MAG: MmcQ/YjbR family DNA-binding protein [Maricaulaceae bacterium]